jgi:hypothetical protein
MLDDTGAADEGEAEPTTTEPVIAAATTSLIVCLSILIPFAVARQSIIINHGLVVASMLPSQV